MRDANGVSPKQHPGFRNPTRLANWARGFLCVGVAAQVSRIAHHTRAFGAFSETGEAAASPATAGYAVLLAATSLTTAVLVSKWIYRANCNARALGASGMAFSPRAAVGWYFVPVANLWKPYQAMKEIWQASVSPFGWRRQPVSWLVPCWWLLLGLLGSWTAAMVAWTAQKSVDAIDETAAERLGEAAAQGVLIPASLLLVVIIGRVHAMQTVHHKRQFAAGRTPGIADTGIRSAARGEPPREHREQDPCPARRCPHRVRPRGSASFSPPQLHSRTVAHHFRRAPAHFGGLEAHA